MVEAEKTETCDTLPNGSELKRSDVLPNPFPRKPEYYQRIGSRTVPVGDKIYRRPVNVAGKIKWVPITPLNPHLFRARADWWKRHKHPVMDKYQQAWDFDSRFWKINDFHRDSWYERMYKENSLRRAMSKDGTIRVINSMQQLATGMSNKHEGGNAVIVVGGHKRVGKSFMMRIIATNWLKIMKREFGYEGEIETVFGTNQIRKIMPKCVPGDFIIADESAKTTSSGSLTASINLTNLLEITGVKQIGVGIIGPNYDYRQIGGAMDIGIEHWGSNFDFEMCRGVVYDKKGAPIFSAAFQRNYLWNDFPSYASEKDEKATAIIEDQGAEEVWDEEQFQEDVARLLKYAKNEYKYMLKKKKFPRISSLVGDAKTLKVRGYGDYVKNVASKVRDRLENHVYSLPDEDSSPRGSIRPGAIPEGEEELHPLAPYLIAATTAIVSNNVPRASERAIERLCNYYFKDMSYPDIADYETNSPDGKKTTANNIGKAVRSLKEKLSNKDIGDIGELAVIEFLKSRLPHAPILGGARCGCLKKGDNDLDVAIGDLKSEMFTAINVKLYLSERDGSVIHSSPEYKHNPHVTVIVEVGPLRVDVMLNAEEVETQVQAREAGRLVTLEDLVRMLQFQYGGPKE